MLKDTNNKLVCHKQPMQVHYHPRLLGSCWTLVVWLGQESGNLLCQVCEPQFAYVVHCKRQKSGTCGTSPLPTETKLFIRTHLRKLFEVLVNIISYFKNFFFRIKVYYLIITNYTISFFYYTNTCFCVLTD